MQQLQKTAQFSLKAKTRRKNEISVKSQDHTFPVVLVPTLKCEALHQDYFQVKTNTKVPAETGSQDSNPQHVIVEHSSLSPTKSSTPPTKLSPESTALNQLTQDSSLPTKVTQDSKEHFLSHDITRSHDLIPQSPSNSADKNIKSTSLSDLCRLSPHYDDHDYNPCQGLTQSCHEYYNTQQTSLLDGHDTSDLKQPHAVGGSLTVLSNSELISCTKSVTQIQQAKKRCIPKAGIRTIPLIKIKPELKSLGYTNDKREISCESKDKSGKDDTCIDSNNQDYKDKSGKNGNGTDGDKNVELVKDQVDDDVIIGEVIVHKAYTSDAVNPVSVDGDSCNILDVNKRELSTIIEENKVINESGSEQSLEARKHNTGVNNGNETNVDGVDDIEGINVTAEPRSTISTPDIQWTPRLRDKIGVRKGSLFDDSETANTNDSLFVNKDEDSLNTVTDIQEEEFCTQFSDTEEDHVGVNNCAQDKQPDNNSESDTSEYDNVSDDFDNTLLDVNNGVKRETIKQSSSAIDGIIESERLERQLKARTSLSLGRDSKLGYFGAAENLRSSELRNIQSDSEGTLYYSFNSLDSARLNESCGGLSKGSRRLPLKWTPRVLLESRISSLTSGTFSEASFHTADTFGTFYSARSFQLDSCDNFQTCEDFQKYENIPETKSKFSRAKEAIIRGKDFVKAKFEDYRKRIPNIRRINLGDQSACQRTCGFSCVHLGKEISQYSLPETFGLKGGNSDKGDNTSDCKGDNCEELCEGQSSDYGEESDFTELRMGKENGAKGEREQNSKNGEQKKGPKRSNNDDSSRKQNGAGNIRGTVRMDLESRGATEDDLPVGSEALSIPRSKKTSENGDSDGKPVSKRLRWVSAVEKTQGTSLTSSFASNSSVEQLLTQRQMDPESMLRNLGFDGGANTDESANRIPDRFLLNPCGAKGIDIQEFVLTHPEIQHLVPEPSQHIRGASPAFPLDDVDGHVECSTPIKGNMQQHHFSSLLQGVRFLHHTQSLGNVHTRSPTYQVPDDEMKRISSIPSVLDFPNRRFLAKQGFYGKEFSAAQKKQKADESKQQAQSVSASERRKQFQHAGRSKNWSLTEDSETDNSESSEKSDPHKDNSFDQGLMLRSFSERFSSESSLESSDSFGDKRDELRRQNSISHLRKQYQDTIRNSIDTTDRDIPVFDPELETLGIETNEVNEIETKDKTGHKDKSVHEGRKKISKQGSISDIRKVEVDRLMSAEDDDGDYFAHSLRSSWKEPLMKLAQHSTQSTLTGSPKTPKEFSYSFDKNLQDGEEEFDFPSVSDKKETSDKWIDQSPAVSIVIEDDNSNEGEVIHENFTSVQSNPNELAPLHVIKRTDSSNTIVQGEYLSDVDHNDGDLTPRPGDISPGLMLQAPDFTDNKLIHVDALSESTSSSETWTTVLPAEKDLEVKGQNEMAEVKHNQNGPAVQQEVKGQRSTDGIKDFLKPDIPRPQESFELEEISSADNMFEDINGNTTKSHTKLGQLEKSLSTHSDSSGFADIDQVGEMAGEATPYIPESLKGRRRSLSRQSTFGKHNSLDLSSNHGNHDNHSSSQSQSLLHQTENRERKLHGPASATVNQDVVETFANEFRHEKLHVCGKARSKDDLENDNPSLQSISYIPCDKAQSDKSVVYSISVPVATLSSKSEPTGKVRYISTVKFEVDSESSVDNESMKSCKITQAGPVLHQKILTDLELGDLGEGREGHRNLTEDINDDNGELNDDNVQSKLNGAISRANIIYTDTDSQNVSHGDIRLPSNSTDVHTKVDTVPENEMSDSTRQRVLKKRRSKEALIASTSQTADWLLSNEKEELSQSISKKREMANTLTQSRIGKPIWASTPNLNVSLIEREKNKRGFRNNHIGKSLDIDIDDELEENAEFKLSPRQQTSLSQQTSLNDSCTEIFIRPSSSQNVESVNRQITEISHDIQNYATEMRHDFLLSPAQECVPLDGSSYIGSSTGMPEELVQYIKLAKLVNGPSQIVGPHIKMPIVKFKPNIHMKDWTLLPKQKHLEEETRLMQHAVQRYKIELLAMETMLFNMRQIAEHNLNREERLEVEELQHLWSEVRKEVNKMEELLSVRLSTVLNGNNNYNPLDAVEIVHSMIELLREQLYHQQMSIERDTHIDIIEEHEMDRQSHSKSSNRSSMSFDPWLSDLSQQMSDIKLSVSRSQRDQKEELEKSLTELKDSILSEVREEVSSTQNVKMLQLQVQAREHEIKRLKLELLQQNIETGKTRKRQTFESDV